MDQKDNHKQQEVNNNGFNLANAAPGEEIVISGLSGHYPDSHDVYHFRDNLYNKVDMVSEDNRRWEPKHPEIPRRSGKMYNIEKFDAGYFGISESQAHQMDPMVRLLAERTVEAVFDAGIHPSELEGTNTGVFVGACFSESEKTWFFDKAGQNRFAATGCERSMIAHRISYHLKLKGPAYVADTACSSSLYALEHAYKALRTGLCERAIVGGTNLCLHPFVSLQFARLGVLSLDGSCKSFDAAGNGYARSEAVCAVILEKAKCARRIYSTVVHAKTNCDGYKEQGITYPSGDMQRRLLQEFYEECKVDPSTLSFLEAHGTGTKVGDPEEITAIDEIFCKNRKKPLMIGSVKSNIGHTEPSSGLCSITKCIIGMEHGYIPPNIHYNKPREGVKPLEDGKLKVVVDKTPFEDDRGLVGVNSFGFGGGNAHVLLKWNEKRKVNNGLPKDNLSRLVALSGRTQKSVETFFKHILGNQLDVEYIRLLHQLFSKNINSHIYRGYIILNKNGEVGRTSDYYPEERRNLYIAFGNFSKSWRAVAFGLSEFPVFIASLQRVHNILSPLNVNLNEIIKGKITNQAENLLGSAAVLIAIIDILKLVGQEVAGCFGNSIGRIMSAYYYDQLTTDEAILAVYILTKNLPTNDKEKPIYYHVNMDVEQIKHVLPESVEVRAIIDKNNVIIGGPKNVIDKLVLSLKKAQVEIQEAELDDLQFVQKNRSVVANELHQLLKLSKHKNGIIVDQLLDQILEPINLSKVIESMERKSIILDIGTGVVAKAADDLKDNLITYKEFTNNNTVYTFNDFLHMLGSLYVVGHNLQLDKLYPKVEYPVSRGTPMISPSIRWEWRNNWHITRYNTEVEVKSGEKEIKVALNDDHWKFVTGHVIDGRNLFPATGYLQVVWETFAHIKGVLISDMQVVFENCKFYRATTVPKVNTSLELTVMLQRGTGNFEVIESEQAIVKGRIRTLDDLEGEQINLPVPTNEETGRNITMNLKDVYKELRLRGYNYKGDFKGIKECNAAASRGMVKWNGNWITFMDNMLQMKILEVDTRLLYVPTGIKKITIDSKKHIEYVKTCGEDNPDLPVYVYKDLGIIRSGAIEIQGLTASSIALRKPLGEPVLEKYEFVPNIANLTTEQSVRVNMQILLENFWSIKIKVVELFDEGNHEDPKPLSPIILEALGDQPLIQPNVSLFTKNQELKFRDVTVEDRKMVTETDCHLIVGWNVLGRPHIQNQLLGALKENGFIISRENPDVNVANVDQSILTILTAHRTENETIFLCRKTVAAKKHVTVNISDENLQFEWVDTLKAAVKNDGHVVVYAQNDPLSGILGLINCLRREPGGSNVKTFFIADNNIKPLNIEDEFFQNQLNKNLGINVFKNGKWGTYRHLLLPESPEVITEHCFVNVTMRGDLSSLKWIEGPLRHNTILKPENKLVHIYYAALNFRDIMTASGRINADVITQDRTAQECVQGFEFSGRDSSGRRVMGMIVHGALSTLISADTYLLWEIPDIWTLEEAATIPTVYGTVLYALINRANIKKGDSILIHSGTGGIGQAAINYCLHLGCKVYTTVGTLEKREFLKKKYPQLKDCHIGNSRDTSFEALIKKETQGRGVDIILNSLAEEKLQASVRCLAKGGRFLEIGKFDLANDNPLHILFLEKEASFHGIMLDQLFTENPIWKMILSNNIEEGIKSGAVKPLPTTVFKSDEVEKAFRYMASGKHMGKVLVNVRKEEPEKIIKPEVRLFKGIPRYFCDSEKSYIIIGGLGGFGLELADWLVLRGARRLVLTSRSGMKTGYQSLRLRIWTTYGVTTKISTADIKTKEGCVQLIKEAQELGPVESIFNLAVVLKDAIFENQDSENFKISFGPKAIATKNLDEVTRNLCPDLRDFVIFSSVSCGRGNAGQTNYGMANSVMERICEKRRSDGFPALAIEWGAIGDVGLVAEMQEDNFEMEIGGTLQQKISSCLKVLDVFLRQNAAVVSSMVVAEKRAGAGTADNVVDAVAHILGIRDLMSISLHSTLAELGMDSMTAVEIKQTLEREFDVFLTAQDIRSMTFARLQEIQQERESESDSDVKKDKALVGMDMLVRLMGREDQMDLPVIELTSKLEDLTNAKTVILFPGVEGVATVLNPLVKNLEARTIGLQYCYDDQVDKLDEMSQNLYKTVKQQISKDEPFFIIGYSFGCILALEVIARLEADGYQGTFVSIDGAPAQLLEFKSMLDLESEHLFETSLVLHLMALHVPYEVVAQYREAIFKCNTFEDKLKKAQEFPQENTPHSPEHQRKQATAVYKRIKGLITYQPTYSKINAPTTLFKPKQNSMHVLRDDYRLADTIGQTVRVEIYEGNHVTMLENAEMAHAINKILQGEKDEPVEEQKESVVEKPAVEYIEKPVIVDAGLRLVEIEDKNI